METLHTEQLEMERQQRAATAARLQRQAEHARAAEEARELARVAAAVQKLQAQEDAHRSLCGRFPELGEGQVSAALAKAKGHAGRAAAILRDGGLLQHRVGKDTVNSYHRR